MKIILKPKTQKGKNLVQRFGNEWLVLSLVPKKVIALDNDLGILIIPVTHLEDTTTSRWIRVNGDVNFDHDVKRGNSWEDAV